MLLQNIGMRYVKREQLKNRLIHYPPVFFIRSLTQNRHKLKESAIKNEKSKEMTIYDRIYH